MKNKLIMAIGLMPIALLAMKTDHHCLLPARELYNLGDGYRTMFAQVVRARDCNFGAFKAFRETLVYRVRNKCDIEYVGNLLAAQSSDLINVQKENYVFVPAVMSVSTDAMSIIVGALMVGTQDQKWQKRLPRLLYQMARA